MQVLVPHAKDEEQIKRTLRAFVFSDIVSCKTFRTILFPKIPILPKIQIKRGHVSKSFAINSNGHLTDSYCLYELLGFHAVVLIPIRARFLVVLSHAFFVHILDSRETSNFPDTECL